MHQSPAALGAAVSATNTIRIAQRMTAACDCVTSPQGRPANTDLPKLSAAYTPSRIAAAAAAASRRKLGYASTVTEDPFFACTWLPCFETLQVEQQQQQQPPSQVARLSCQQ